MAIFLIGLDHGLGGLVDAAGQGHRIGPGGNHPQPFAIDGLGQHGGGGGAVAGDVVGLRGRFFDQLGAEVFVRVVQLDLLGHGHAVLGDLGRPNPCPERRCGRAGPSVLPRPGPTCSLRWPAAAGPRRQRPSVLPQRIPPVAGVRLRRTVTKIGSRLRFATSISQALCQCVRLCAVIFIHLQ